MNSGQPAPYGRACVNCARAKCKCITGANDGICERCARLNKDCQPSATVRKKNTRKWTASRTAQLEEKLDGLVSLLKQKADANKETPNASPDDSSTNSSSHYRTNTTYSASKSPWTEASTNHDIAPELPPTLHPGADVTPQEALINFRKKLGFFPFIYIPESTSCAEISQTRPFLWECIMSISSKSPATQLMLGNKIRHSIAQKVLFDMERSMDLLLGLLSHIAWLHCQAENKACSTALIQMAISLCFDLGLNKPRMQDYLAMTNAPGSRHKAFPAQTLEERRAVLACYILSCNSSLFKKRMDPMQWTPFMDESLEQLLNAKECENDESLVRLVQLMRVAEKASITSLSMDPTSANTSTDVQATMIRHALDSELREIKRQIPEGNFSLLMYFYHAEMTVYETELCRKPNRSFSSPKRLENLWHTLFACKNWFDTLFSMPLEDYRNAPFIMWTQYLRLWVVTTELCTLEDRSWDRTTARVTIDPIDVLTKLIDRMTQVASAVGLRESETYKTPFEETVKVFTLLRSQWEERFAATTLQTMDTTMPQFTGPPMTDFMEMSHDPWLFDYFDSWGM